MSTPRPTEPPIQAESVVLRLRRHGRALTLPVLVLTALAGASGFWVGTLPETWMNLAALGGAVAIALLLGVGPVLGWLSRRTLVTNRRVITRRGVFVQHRSEVPLNRVREVRSKRTVMQRVFGSGDIELLGGAGGIDGSTVLRDVPGFVLVTDALQELIELNFAHDTRGQAAFSGQGGPVRVPGSPATQAPYGHGDTVSIPR
ncbi:PH domain-containing protein [Leucobacter sp. W1153]|uniref:PH domain-containing protein n=1 Tax=Leucobacter sp. W1153 TaxID=3439064 RepID=UPI003F2FA07E